MARKKSRGYFVNGEFVARGSERDDELQAEVAGDVPSKTQLKTESAALQALGVALAELTAAQRAPIALPDRAEIALEQLAQIRNFEGLRRQRQYVGKLMRALDGATVERARLALERAQAGSQADTALLHEAEAWRERLLSDDDAATQWATAFPGSDLQRLRTLVRQARKDAPAPDTAAPRGQEAQRHARAYRELFQLLRQALVQRDDEPA